MSDRKPPRLADSECATLLVLLQYQRESLIRKVAGVHEADAQRSIVPSGTSLLWLIKHMMRAEIVWILSRFAGENVVVPDDRVEARDVLANAIHAYRLTWRRVDAIVLAATSLDALCAQDDIEPAVNLRWVIAHLLEETARHAGHADILRELIDGSTGR